MRGDARARKHFLNDSAPDFLAKRSYKGEFGEKLGDRFSS
jgi:hypothetical protein